nr:ribonuclease H-like domain-containing protein [Tanacetum cinerariifolium]
MMRPKYLHNWYIHPPLLRRPDRHQPTSDQSSPNITHPAIIPDPLVNPNPTSVHSMVTRFPVGSNKLTQRLNFHRIIRSLHQEFAMTDLGPLNNFMGVSVTRDSSGLFLSQQKYVVEILEKAHMLNCNPSRTPVDTVSKLGVGGDPVSNLTLYRSLACSLQYLTFTRPDISYAVQQVCLHMHDPRESHLSDLKRILRLDVPLLGDQLSEAEYHDVANVVAETCWLLNLLHELHTPLSFATLVYCDNVSAAYLSCNSVQHQHTKHIEIDIHFIRGLVVAGQSRTIGNKHYLLIVDENQAFETLPMLHSGLHYTHINVPQVHMAVKEKYCDPVYVPIAPPQRIKIGPQRRLGIYVGYKTSSIIRNVEPLTGDVFTARFVDCQFNEAIFLLLGGEKKTHEKDVAWSEPSLLYLDPRTKQSKNEVQKIMHLQEIANQLPDTFTYTKRVTKSHIPAANAPTQVELPNKQAGNNIAQESQKRLKHGRPISSRDKNPRQRKGTEKNSDHDESVLDETQNIKTSPEEEINDMNKEMSINYRRDEKNRLDHLKQDLSILVIKSFSERMKVLREKEKTEKFRAKENIFLLEIEQYL